MSAENIIEQAANGSKRLSLKEIESLFSFERLAALGCSANKATCRLHPEPYRTYIVDRNINYTNVCVSGCRFCAFYRSSNSPDAFVLNEEQVLQKVEEAISLGAVQILMQGGLNPDLPLEYYTDLLKAVKSRFEVQIHSFSPPEIVFLSRNFNITVRETLSLLLEAGLDSLPGGGAEILSNRIRRAVSPHKCTADEWISVMETAAELGLRATATMMFGHIEDYSDRAEHLVRIRDLQDRTNVFTAFIPWTFQPGNTGLRNSPVGAHDYLKTLAISRLALDNIPNIQASWVTQGLAVAQAALHFGANDLGGTMIEENVVAAAGMHFTAAAEDLEANIRAAGYLPARRNTKYDILNTSNSISVSSIQL